MFVNDFLANKDLVKYKHRQSHLSMYGFIY